MAQILVDNYKFQITPNQLNEIREKLREFLRRIKVETPDQQHKLLKDFITEVRASTFSDSLILKFHISIDDSQAKLLEKNIHFYLN